MDPLAEKKITEKIYNTLRNGTFVLPVVYII